MDDTGKDADQEHFLYQLYYSVFMLLGTTPGSSSQNCEKRQLGVPQVSALQLQQCVPLASCRQCHPWLQRCTLPSNAQIERVVPSDVAADGGRSLIFPLARHCQTVTPGPISKVRALNYGCSADKLQLREAVSGGTSA